MNRSFLWREGMTTIRTFAIEFMNLHPEPNIVQMPIADDDFPFSSYHIAILETPQKGLFDMCTSDPPQPSL